MNDVIEIQGARVHNLKNITLSIPRNKFIVITGVSGSGKSSLAFDTLYAEGQRRYVESLSAYARQFLERMDKPDVDHIKGISPALAIEQRTLAKNPRSTVGTVTEVYDYLRLLFGRIGQIYCSQCGSKVRRDTVTSVVNELLRLELGTRLYVLFSVPAKESEILKLHEAGFYRVLVKGEIVEMSDEAAIRKLLKQKEIMVLVDRLAVSKESKTRIAESVESAFLHGSGKLIIRILDQEDRQFSNKLECNTCGALYLEPDPKLFSFNNPYGACSSCQGFGNRIEIDMDLVIPDKSKSLRKGAIKPWTTDGYADYQQRLEKAAKKHGIPLDVPVSEMKPDDYRAVLEGRDGFKGIQEFFKWLETKTYKMHVRVLLSKYRGYVACSSCKGSRLRSEANCIQINGKTIHDLHRMTVADAHEFLRSIVLSDTEKEIARRVLDEIIKRINYLKNVGLEYLTFDRLAGTLSGGEAQRISLASSLGSALVGSLYILDEPSIGLHSRDNDKLIRILRNLQSIGNTVVVVEHDSEVMRQCDEIIDMGPRAGTHGGQVVFQGPFIDIIKDRGSLTGQYLSGSLDIDLPTNRRTKKTASIRILGASENNLKKIDLDIPLGRLVCVTGVSGSGKSTLVHDILYAGLMRKKGMWSSRVGAHDDIEGAELVSSVEMVDQQPIGRTPRSNPATYLKVFDVIRDVFASTPTAKLRGYKSGTFSFNVPGGRCETCEGAGQLLIEMQFLADVYLECEECKGTRYKKEVLEVHFHDKNIHDVLSLTVSEAINFFSSNKKILSRLSVLDEVGLGYLKLGQSATTLSGGEAQRVKLAAHLSEKSSGPMLYLFDEPTTGLHFDDIKKLLGSFQKLIEAGHSLVVIEHNLDVIKCADHIIDLGPEGGDKGGTIVATGTPEQIARVSASYTGFYLKPYLAGHRNSS